MNNKGTKSKAAKIKEIKNKADMMTGCENRMCVTDDREELFKMYAYLTLYATDLYRLNRERLVIAKYGDDEPPAID